MDTGTHIVMGVALGGLATLDPAVQNDPELFGAVFAGTVIGSHAPDFDTVLKLRNNAVYIRHHRGITHSMPAVLLWGILLAGIIYAILPSVSFGHLWLWTALAVVIHVLVDIPNAYGTQALRPFSHKWVAHGVINTFDPYIFLLLAGGIVAWLIGANPGYTFLILYAVIALYYIKRYIDKREIIRKIKDHYPETRQIVTSPTIKQNRWRVAITTNDYFYVGKVKDGHIDIIDQFRKVPLPDNELFRIARQDKNIDAFLSFSPVYRWEQNDYDDVTEIRLIDLRYRSNDRYPFVAVALIDENKQILNSYTGWIYSEQKLQNKLEFRNSPI
ncbi:metal-dependent hydrolase [Barrientosiimonas marina]|uniref:Metal-dependent hydrolase n=1 Tax=Lentibacillus kimchii TaxID=1542911 RepID=A0ABW2UQ07_9BACI